MNLKETTQKMLEHFSGKELLPFAIREINLEELAKEIGAELASINLVAEAWRMIAYPDDNLTREFCRTLILAVVVGNLSERVETLEAQVDRRRECVDDDLAELSERVTAVKRGLDEVTVTRRQPALKDLVEVERRQPPSILLPPTETSEEPPRKGGLFAKPGN